MIPAQEAQSRPSQIIDTPPNGFTFKAFVLGTLFTLAISVGDPYANMIVKGSYMSIDFTTAAAVFFQFILCTVGLVFLRGMTAFRAGYPHAFLVLVALAAGIGPAVISQLSAEKAERAALLGCFLLAVVNISVATTMLDHRLQQMNSRARRLALGFCAIVLLVAFHAGLAGLLRLLPPFLLPSERAGCQAVVLAFSAVFAVLSVLYGLRPPPALQLGPNRSELLVIYSMMLVACAVPTMGLTEQLLPIPPAVFYYATPENDWSNLIHPHVWKRLVPEDPLAIKYFYEGLPKGVAIPYGQWVLPLACWLPCILVAYLTMICAIVLLRKQWVERERLIFPLTRLPQEMVQEPEDGALANPFFRSRMFWFGVAIPFTISSFAGLRSYFPYVPPIPTVWPTVNLLQGTIPFAFRLSFPVVGFAYLINLDIIFSIWFFNRLTAVQHGVQTLFGWKSVENMGIYGVGKSADLAHQGLGAMIVMVLLGLWVGRAHLRDVVRKAFWNDPGVDDSDEILSYRTAFFGFLAGLLFLACWLRLSGMGIVTGLCFLLVAYLIFVGLCRIVVEGVGEGVASTISSSFVVSTVGSSALSPASLTSLGFTWVWTADIRTYVLASVAHVLKLSDGLGRHRRPLFWAIVLAILVSLVSSIWVILYLSYTYGGINLNSWFFGGGAKAPFEYVANKLRESPDQVEHLQRRGWGFTLFGGTVMALLIFARQCFLWWPFHPIGFPIGPVWLMDSVWLSIFIAWVIKWFVLRYGGHRLFVRLRPFFLGLIGGQFFVAGLWLVIDFFTGKVGNSVFWI